MNSLAPQTIHPVTDSSGIAAAAVAQRVAPEFAGRGDHLGLLDQGKTDGYQAFAQDLAHAHHVLVRTQRNHPHIDVVANQDVTFRADRKPASGVQRAS